MTPGTAERRAFSAASARARSVGRVRFAARPRVEVGQVAAHQQFGGREPGIGIFGRFARPSPCARSTKRRAPRREKSDDATLADRWPEEDAQADLLAFGALDVLELAEAHLHAARAVADVDGVGGVGAGVRGALDERLGDLSRA